MQGYDIRVHRLLEEAGLVLPEAKRVEIAEQAKTHHDDSLDANGDFTSLETCNEVTIIF